MLNTEYRTFHYSMFNIIFPARPLIMLKKYAKWHNLI